MPWTETEYTQAKELVAQVEDPKQRARLDQAISRYEASRPKSAAPDAARQGAAARGLNPQLGAMGAATGLEALEQNKKFTGESKWTPEDAKQARGLPKETAGTPEGESVGRALGEYERSRPEKETGFRLARSKSGGRELTDRTTVGGELAALPSSPEADKTGLPSATGKKQLYRPPEFVPPGLSFQQAMKARIEFEPSVDEFRAAAAQKLGAHVFDLDENSPEYKTFADELWAQKYDVASRAGLPLTRKAYMNTDSWQGQTASFLHAARDNVEAALMGAASGLTFGTGDEAVAAAMGQTDELRAQKARRPVATAIGNVAGAVNPASGATALASAGSRLAPTLGRLGSAVVAGGVTGATEGAVGAAAQQGADALQRGRTGVAPVNGAQSIGRSAAVGAIGGAAGGALGAGLNALGQRAVRSLREHIPELVTAERGGVQTSLLGRVKPTPEIQAAMDASRRSPVNASAQDIALRGVKAPIAAEGSRRSQDVLARVGAQNAAYEATEEGLQSYPTRATTQKLSEVIRRGQNGLGEDRSFANNSFFKKAYLRAFTPMVMPVDAARVAASDGGWVMKVSDAKQLGIFSSKMPPPSVGGGEASGPMRVVMVPNKLNAQEMRLLAADIDRAGDVSAGRAASKKRAAGYQEVVDAIRRDLSQFEPNAVTGFDEVQLPGGQKARGLAAMRYKHHQELGGVEGQLFDAGLPEQMGPGGLKTMQPAEKKAFATKLRGIGRSPLETEAAMGSLARGAGVEKQLRTAAAIPAFQTLRVGGEPSAQGLNTSFLRTLAGGITPGRSLRADPAMRGLAHSRALRNGGLGAGFGAGAAAARPISPEERRDLLRWLKQPEARP